VLDDVVSLVDLRNGAEAILHNFICNVEQREHGTSSEHHGGNPTIASDGTIFVGIGEYNEFKIAQQPEWNGGKIFSIDRDGNVAQFAFGLRNPYDLAWDPELERIVVGDNGPTAGDELHIIDEGSNCGWPHTVGHEPQVNGSVAPDYVFPETVAPTGIARLARDANPLLRRGYLVGAFVTRSLYYFDDLSARPIAAPLAIVDHFDEAVIDVTQAPSGNVYLATARFPPASRIQRLVVPSRGDCDGDGFADSRDVSALLRELGDGDPHPMISAQDGVYPGSWGCDADSDGLIGAADLAALGKQLSRKRAVKVR
jgi:glucose/arabinose dehydrogenase